VGYLLLGFWLASVHCRVVLPAKQWAVLHWHRLHLAHDSGQGPSPRSSHITTGVETLQGLEISTHNLEDLHFSMNVALARSDGGDDVMCGICMEQPETIQLTRCSHNLCAVCARQLLAVAASSACQCPFCRKYIGGFAAAEDKAGA
jgi:hypothetical protein